MSTLTRRGARGRLLLAGLTFTVTMLGVVCLAELVVRSVAPQAASWLDIYRRHPRLPVFSLQPNAMRLVDTGETRWTVHTDEHGFRTEASPAPPSSEAPTALVLGDSFTFAHGVDHEQGFVARLARDAPSSYRYLNTAVPGYGPVQYRQTLEYELDRRRPSLILVGSYLGNDLHDCIWDKDVAVRGGVVGDTGDLKSHVKRRSHLYRLLSKVYHMMAPSVPHGPQTMRQLYAHEHWQDGGALHEASRIYAEEMQRIAELAHSRASELLVVLIPPRASVEARREGRGEVGSSTSLDYDLPLRRVSQALRSRAIPFVDVTEALASQPTSQVYFTYDGHLTPLGHRLVAETIAPELEAMARMTSDALDPRPAASPAAL